MTELFILYSFFLILAGLLAMGFSRIYTANRIYAGAVLCASLAMLIFLCTVFLKNGFDSGLILTGWQLPFASLSAGIDSLTAFFLIPLLVLTASSALYGQRYMDGHHSTPSHWFFFSLLVSGMVMVLLARNAILFLIAWEIMSLSSFFLVITETKNPKSIQAGWLYFVTAHIGTAFLLVLFFLLSFSAGSFEFSAWSNLNLSVSRADTIFIIALIAFGLKAGFIPFHVWLPLAHPQAPSHVSALMSGIMIKMGIYGILRVMTFTGPYHPWWGILLIALGSLSGILGVLFAIGQHDLKRLLAYHSVENIGIILLGLGIGIIGAASGSSIIALFGFCGGLLHILNHALFKSLLFLGAGAVIRQTGIGEIDQLGGLIKKMPRTGALFLTGSIAICGLPFFNGFISELMIYIAAITGATMGSSITVALAGLSTVVALALIGGLASACFTKVFGVIFQGEPRKEFAAKIIDAPASMIWAMAFLAFLCVCIGLLSFAILPVVIKPAIMFAGTITSVETAAVRTLTINISILLAGFLTVSAIIFGIVKIFRKKKIIAQTVTWDCGYSRPAVSMQYTASSFAAPIVGNFAVPLSLHKKIISTNDFLPVTPWSFHSHVNDWFLSKIFAPLVRAFDRAFSSLRWFQNGRTGHYIAYIAITLLCLIIWKFFL